MINIKCTYRIGATLAVALSSLALGVASTLRQVKSKAPALQNIRCKARALLSALIFLFLSPLQAQDLAGYQKLRGAVISSPPEDEYTVHAYNAFDTNKATCFKARDYQGWVGLDLKSEYVIKKIRIFPRSDRTERMDGCIFQGSNDAGFTHPTDLFTVTQIPEANQYATYDVVSTAEFRYVRCLAPNTNCNLAELEFYGEEGAYPQLTNLPTIYIETKGRFNFTDKSEYAASSVIISSSGVKETFDASVRGRGNSSWEFMDKKSFRIKFDKKQHFLGLPANAKNWTLIACAVDKTLLRNGLAFEISRALGFAFTPACEMVDVVLDGFYYGTYMASDHIEVDKDRINIDEMEPSDIQLPEITGGYHLEIDAYADQEPVHFRTPQNVPFSIKSPDSDEILPVQREWIENYIFQLEELLFRDTEAAFEQYIDLESAVKYYLHSELTGNCDSYWCIPCYKKRGDGKLYFGPVWDYDQAFLTNERVPRFFPTLETQHGVAQHWFRRMMQTLSAQNELSRLWKKVKKEDLKQHLLDYLDENAARLQQSQALNYQRWHSINRKVWFEDALFNTYDEYIDFVKQFIEDRFAWFDEICQEPKEVLLPASSPGNPPREWQYTTETPDPGWYEPGYDDHEWQSGPAPFGTEQNLQNTFWQTEQIYIRTRFWLHSEDLHLIDKAFFQIFHDEDCQVYLNGQLALERRGYITNYQFFEFDKTLLREDWNTLAIKCVQTEGGQLIDAGIYVTREEGAVDTKDTASSRSYPWLVRDGRLYISRIEDGLAVRLYGVDGKLLKQQVAAGGECQFTLPARGAYLVRLHDTTIKIKY
ncbi:MAG: CotH kinase family protein [Dysgonamonadaceae bacterium]|nr:CotH kinase family protein [Dysgonamonadaceae bacterium]